MNEKRIKVDLNHYFRIAKIFMNFFRGRSLAHGDPPVRECLRHRRHRRLQLGGAGERGLLGGMLLFS